MSGRKRRQSDSFRDHHVAPRPVLHRGAGPLPPHPAALEEELEFQHRDIQRFVAENRHVVEENVILQRELSAVKDEIHRLGQVMFKVRADKDAHARDLIERGIKLEAELRASEPLRAEVMQLRAEAEKGSSIRLDLSAQVETLTKDITRMQAENKQAIVMRKDIDSMRKELVETRRAFEREKKANEEQVEQKQAMEKNLISIAREIEKLRAERLSAERRGRGHAGGGYGMLSGSPEMRYPGSAYGDVYGGGAWGPYDNLGPPRR